MKQTEVGDWVLTNDGDIEVVERVEDDHCLAGGCWRYPHDILEVRSPTKEGA